MKGKKWLLLALLLVSIMGATGCGAILNGTKQSITISAPSDVLVKSLDNEGITDAQALSKGSTTLNLKKNRKHTIVAEKNGSAMVCGNINLSHNWDIIIADLFLGPIGVIVDWSLGGWNNLEPTIVTCQLSDSPKTVSENMIEPKISENKIEPQSIKIIPEQQGDSVSKLKKLKDAFDSGVLTKDEYALKRSKILESL